MNQTIRATILGMKKFVGNIDGKAYDMTKIFIQTSLDAATGNAVGFATQELNAGDSKIFEQCKSMKFPCDFDVDFQFVSTGKVMKQIVTGLRPAVKNA